MNPTLLNPLHHWFYFVSPSASEVLYCAVLIQTGSICLLISTSVLNVNLKTEYLSNIDEGP